MILINCIDMAFSWYFLSSSVCVVELPLGCYLLDCGCPMIRGGCGWETDVLHWELIFWCVIIRKTKGTTVVLSGVIQWFSGFIEVGPPRSLFHFSQRITDCWTSQLKYNVGWSKNTVHRKKTGFCCTITDFVQTNFMLRDRERTHKFSVCTVLHNLLFPREQKLPLHLELCARCSLLAAPAASLCLCLHWNITALYNTQNLGLCLFSYYQYLDLHLFPVWFSLGHFQVCWEML